MIKTFLQNGKPFTAEVQRQGSGYYTGLSEEGQPDSQLAVEAFETASETFVLRTAAGVVRGHYLITENGDYYIHINGKHFRFTAAGASAEAELTQGFFRSPMPGKVIAVEVQPGDEVAAGSTLIVVEAMKMENAIKTEGPGKVTAVRCKPGDLISPEDVLVEVEPVETD